MNISNKGPAIDITQAAAKTEAAKKETTLDKVADYAKEKTEAWCLLGERIESILKAGTVNEAPKVESASGRQDHFVDIRSKEPLRDIRSLVFQPNPISNLREPNRFLPGVIKYVGSI